MLWMNRNVVICVFGVGLLAGCGGGGGAMRSGDATPTPTPPRTTESIQSAILQIDRSADSLLASDLLTRFSLDGQSIPLRIETSCVANSCTAAYRGMQISSLSLSDPDPDVREFQLQRTTEQQGVPIVEGRGELTESGITTDATLLGGWLKHNYFAFQLATITRGSGNGVDLADSLIGNAYSIGNDTGRNPVLSGNATWSGGMVGGAVSSANTRIQGDARLTLDVAQMAMDVAFTNIRNVGTRQSLADMTWSDLSVTNGSFGMDSQGNSIQGKFYGPNHEEVGGIFERNQIIGAFGASR